MEGCPWLKAVLVRSAAFMLHRFAGLPTYDATSGFRLFSRRAIEQIAIELDRGFCYSIELSGESPPAGLESLGGSRGVVRTQARHEPFQSATMGAGLSAMVRLWICYEGFVPAAHNGRFEVAANLNRDGAALIRIGIVGTNYGCQVQLPAFRLDPRCEVVALAGSDQARTAALARRAGSSCTRSATGDK